MQVYKLKNKTLNYNSKQESGFAKQHNLFWDDLAGILRTNRVDFLCGDFNMALWRVVPELTRRGLQITMLAFYPWACTLGGGATIIEYPDEDNPDSTTGACHDEVRFDSCGIFALKPVTEVNREYNPEHLRDPDKLVKVPPGQGYPINSYVGNVDSVLTSLRSIHVGGDRQLRLPKCSQKLVNMDMWDPNQALWNGGGHMPLLVYVGDNPYRRNESLVRREGGHIRRGWGPSSENRREHMRRSGQGTWQPRSPEKTTAGASADAADAAPEESAEQPETSETYSWLWSSEPWASNSASSSQWWSR